LASSKIVVLSGHSLFAEGIASSLRQKTTDLTIEVMDAREPDILFQIQKHQPDTVIFDGGDATLRTNCPLDAILWAVPNLHIFQLDPDSELIQIVTGQYHPVASVADIIEAISL